MKALVNTHNQNWLMKVFKDFFLNVQDTYIYGLWIFLSAQRQPKLTKMQRIEIIHSL